MIEMLVSISVLLLAIVGPMTIASRGLSQSIFSRDQITAFYLAQEAIEVVRMRRDSNLLNSSLSSGQWLTNLSSCVNNTCRVEMPNATVSTCSVGGGTCLLYYNSSTATYTHTSAGASASPFTRYIRLTQVGGSGNEIDIEVTVSWRTGVHNKTIVVHEHLFNYVDL